VGIVTPLVAQLPDLFEKASSGQLGKALQPIPEIIPVGIQFVRPLVPVASIGVPSGRSPNIWLLSGYDDLCDGKWPEGTFPVASTDENT